MRFLSLFMLVAIGFEFAQAVPERGCGTLTRNGYLVQNFNSKDLISMVSYEEAVRLFNELKNPKYKIPYLNALEFCEYRAHRISEILAGQGLRTIKVFVEMHNDQEGAGAPAFTRRDYVEGERVSFRATDIAGNEWSWGYHTTPAICVRENGRDRLYALDLSLFKTPVPLSQWKATLTRGINPARYKYYSTNMFSMVPGSQFSAPATAFTQDKRAEVDRILGADWAGHLLFMKYMKNKK